MAYTNLKGGLTTSQVTTLVNTLVPSATTSAEGKVQLASRSAVFAAVSSALAVTPAELMALMASPAFSRMPVGSGGWTPLITGTGAGVTQHAYGVQLRGPTSGTLGAAVLDTVNSSQLYATRSQGRHRYACDFGKLIWLSFGMLTDSDFWNANAVWRVTFGKPSTGTGSGIGALGRQGLGLRRVGTGAVDLIHFNGSQTISATSFTPTYGQSSFYDLIAFGDGTAKVFANGTQVLSTTGLATSLLSDSTGGICLQAEVEQQTSFISPQPIAYLKSGSLYVAP